MRDYVVSPKADEDILEIWRYLYERASVEVANRVEAEIYAVRDAHPKSTGHKILEARFFLLFNDHVASILAAVHWWKLRAVEKAENRFLTVAAQ